VPSTAHSIAIHRDAKSENQSPKCCGIFCRKKNPLVKAGLKEGVMRTMQITAVASSRGRFSQGSADAGGFHSFGAVFKVVFDRFIFSQGAKTFSFDDGMMDENVLAILRRSDETKALLIIEPFNCPGGHGSHSFQTCAVKPHRKQREKCRQSSESASPRPGLPIILERTITGLERKPQKLPAPMSTYKHQLDE
jgi:hypothetical protein